MKNQKFLILVTCLFVFFSGCNLSDRQTSDSNGKNSPVPSGSSSNSGQTGGGTISGEVIENSPEKSVENSANEYKNTGSKIETIYTDLGEKICKTKESNEEEGWVVQECPGVAGYKLELTEGDLRQTINVLAPSGGKYELNFQSNVSSAFSYFGTKAEWRVKKVDGKIKPIALITRFNANEDPNNSEKVTSYLVVTKFDGEFICITDVVKPIKNANQKARDLADVAASKPCLKGNG